MASLGCGGAMRAMPQPQVTYCSNLRQRRLEETAINPDSPKVNRLENTALVTVHIEI
jgi:hypothetical protein